MKDLQTKIASHIPMTGLLNARHLGGYRTKDGALTVENAFVRCETPAKMTSEDIDRLYRFGIRLVIDLRSPEEVEAEPNPMARDGRFEYRNIPVFDTDASPEALTKSGIAMGDLYVFMLDHCKASFQKIFMAILRAQGGVLYHCSAGKDRTGVLSALLLLLAGVGEEDVVREYGYTTVLLAPRVEELKRTLPEGVPVERVDEMLAARPEFIEQVIAHVEKTYGGAEGYLKELGFIQEEIDALRQKLLQQPEETEKGA